MSEGFEEIRAAAEKLRELSERLRLEKLGDEEVAELAREAAAVVSEAGNEVDRALREVEAGEAGRG